MTLCGTAVQPVTPAFRGAFFLRCLRAVWYFRSTSYFALSRFGVPTNPSNPYALYFALPLRSLRLRGVFAFFTALLLSASCSAPHPTQKLTIAAASDLNFAMQEIARRFQAAHPVCQVEIVYGSSGNFFTQINNRAPFDIFLSADMDYPGKLAGAGNQVFTYAVGHIVVWVPSASALEPATALRASTLKHLAIANPRHAPYGRAAQAALQTLGLYSALEPKLVLGENVSQALQFVESGAADAGIVALSLALAPPVRPRGRYWEIPASAYPRMDQGGIILKNSQPAREFRAFLLAEPGRRILKHYGFFVPGE